MSSCCSCKFYARGTDTSSSMCHYNPPEMILVQKEISTTKNGLWCRWPIVFFDSVACHNYEFDIDRHGK